MNCGPGKARYLPLPSFPFLCLGRRSKAGGLAAKPRGHSSSYARKCDQNSSFLSFLLPGEMGKRKREKIYKDEKGLQGNVPMLFRETFLCKFVSGKRSYAK